MNHIINGLSPESKSYESTPSIMAKSMFYYIHSAGHFVCEQDYRTDRKDYNPMLLAYTLEGTGFLRYRGQEYHLIKGQAFIIDCTEPQFYSTGSSGSWEFDWVHFNGSESRSYVLQILENSGPVFTLGEDSIIPGSIKEIHKMLMNRHKRIDIISSKILVEILTELLLKSCSSEEISESHFPSRIQEAIRMMEKEYQQPVNLDELSRELCMSKYHLSRVFKKYTGFSPYEYLIKFRLNQAKSLLKATELSVGEISQKVGFESPSHFIKTFNQQEKVTPLQFRKYWR